MTLQIRLCEEKKEEVQVRSLQETSWSIPAKMNKKAVLGRAQNGGGFLAGTEASKEALGYPSWFPEVT